MAAPKIKKKSSASETSAKPRQAAIPCLIIVILVLIAFSLLLYFSVAKSGS